LTALRDASAGRGFELAEVASGWRFQVATDLAPWVNRLWEEKPQKYSRALLETLALIAYRQPITRSDIEEVRGVAVSSHIIKTLAEREWIKVVGHRDVPGRPSLYATTRQFLDYFGLKSLEELPTLGELKDIDSLNQALELGDDDLVEEREQIAAAKDADEPTTESLFGTLEDEDLEAGSTNEADSHTDDHDSAFNPAESDKSID
jgi:segregation and condensation protein B